MTGIAGARLQERATSHVSHGPVYLNQQCTVQSLNADQQLRREKAGDSSVCKETKTAQNFQMAGEIDFQMSSETGARTKPFR